MCSRTSEAIVRFVYLEIAGELMGQLRIEPPYTNSGCGLHMDLIVVSFVITEKQRREKVDQSVEAVQAPVKKKDEDDDDEEDE